MRQEDGSELPFDPTCMARAFVLRIAFATSVFHLFLALFTIGADDYSNPRIAIHTAMWPVKMLVWTVMHAAVFFMPASFFLGFGWLALALGILFLFVQIIYYIEICFATNEDLLEGRGTFLALTSHAQLPPPDPRAALTFLTRDGMPLLQGQYTQPSDGRAAVSRRTRHKGRGEAQRNSPFTEGMA